MSEICVRDIERALSAAFPIERAEDWDRCGLLAGDPDSVVTGVTVGLDATVGTVRAALAVGSNVLVTHHPAFLEPPRWLIPGRGPSGTAFEALASGVALINAHTNLDRDERAQRLIPEALGLEPVKPLERDLMATSIVTVYVPEDSVERVADAMAGAGAGRIGDYERCTFAVSGAGGFTPAPGSTPFVGTPGESTSTPEVRLEMVCPTRVARGVVSAAVAVHPYEEPLVSVGETRIARNAARLGMVCSAPQSTTLGSLADACAEAFAPAVRVWGDADAPVRKVATTTGSGGSLVGDAFASRCDVLIAGEVRYHDALNAVGSGLAVIELGHDASEWPLVGLLEQVVRGVEGLDTDRVHVLEPVVGWSIRSRNRGAGDRVI